MRPLIGMNPVDQPAEDPLSSLEWMLQSGQAGDGALIDALGRAFYARISALALALLGSGSLAEAATRRTFTQAILQADRYPGGGRLRAWLYGLAVNECESLSRPETGDSKFRAFWTGWQYAVLQFKENRLPQPDNPLIGRADLPAYLFEVHELSADEIAQALKMPEKRVVECLEGRSRAIQNAPLIAPNSETQLSAFTLAVAEQLAASRRRKTTLIRIQELSLVCGAILVMFLFGRVVTALSPTPQPTATAIRKVLATRLMRITTTPRPSATTTPLPENAIYYTVQEGDTLEKIARSVNMPVEILIGLNRLSLGASLTPGKKLIVGVGSLDAAEAIPTPVTPAPTRAALTLASSAEDIRGRIYASRNLWNTLWADALVIDYGPLNYAGPPKVRREQVWYSQLNNSLVLSGAYDSTQADETWVMSDGQVVDANWVTGVRSFFEDGGGRIEFSRLSELIFPYSLSTFHLQVTGKDVVAGRDALVVELAGDDMWGYKLRMWVDIYTGVILRKMYIDINASPVLSSEIVITAIAYDLDFPAHLFRQQGLLPDSFAADPQGDPLPDGWQPSLPAWVLSNARQALTRRPPPPDFDPAGSTLTFQWTGLKDLGAAEDRVDLFAHNYYLGSLPVSMNTVCDRSPDGRLIGFIDWSSGNPSLFWVSLSNLAAVHHYDTNDQAISTGYSLAFSPDSRLLAFFGYESLVGAARGDTGHLFVLNLATGETRSLIAFEYLDSLTWSPDMKQIAFLGNVLPGKGYGVGVVNSSTGELLYRGPVTSGENDKFLVAPDSPTQKWGVPFPPGNKDISSCAEP